MRTKSCNGYVVPVEVVLSLLLTDRLWAETPSLSVTSVTHLFPICFHHLNFIWVQELFGELVRVLSEESEKERPPARVLEQRVEELGWVQVRVRVLDRVRAEDLVRARDLALY